VRPFDLDPDGIADLVERSLLDGAGWSMGVQGALAEFAVAPGENVDVRRHGRTVEALTAGGGLRLAISADTVAYGQGSGTLTLAVPRAALPAPSLRVTVAPADPGALRPEDGPAVLVDLAVGHSVAAFCVRTADPALVGRLRSVEGRTWQEALDEIGHLVVATSPHRVVTGPLGRIEVYNPIPARWDASPEGCHTHLLPALLATGREVAEGEELPPQLAAAGNCAKPG
jgi:hypothetical protein